MKSRTITRVGKINKAAAWEERFETVFVTNNPWKSDNDDTAYAGIGNIKDFIAEELLAQRTALVEQIRGMVPEEAFTDYPDTPDGQKARHENSLFNSCRTEILRRLDEIK